MNPLSLEAERVFLAAIARAEAGRAALIERECGANMDLRAVVDLLLKAHALGARHQHEDPLEIDAPEQSDSADSTPRGFERRGTMKTATAAGSENQTEQRFPLPVEPSGGGSATGPVMSSLDLSGEGTVANEPNARWAAESLKKPFGRQIGPYRLVREIGSGGMGSVFEAEQEFPIRRLVALKIIKPGTDTEFVIDRFKTERQALALMDHPCIAKVFDAGATANDLPFFVMELVDGKPLNAYCDQQRLGVRQRLELFIGICQATEHAHQKGIVHRDLKPSNILVTRIDGRPSPKIIDFGVAKAVGSRLAGLSLPDRPEIVGTLGYMSPEQAEPDAVDIDTRSDIYSLGVILYELLTGSTPLQVAKLRDKGYSAILSMIREARPSAPSARLRESGQNLAAIAAQRRVKSARLQKLVRGDLDWIVMKAIEKDRDRRYATASAFALDVRRFLESDPVAAGPASLPYRVRKYSRKHWATLTTAAAFAAVLVGATVISVAWAIRAMRSEAEAIGVLNFLQDKVLSASRPEGQEGGLGTYVTVHDALDSAEPSIASAFGGQPKIEAAMRHTIGTTYVYQGDARAAVRQFLQAIAIRKTLLGPRHAETLRSQNDLGVAYRLAGQTNGAIETLLEALSGRQSTLGEDDADTLETMNNLAVAYQQAGRISEALALHEEELRRCAVKLGPNHEETLKSLNNLAAAYFSANRLPEAVNRFEQLLERRRSVLSVDHPDVLISLHNLATVYQRSGRNHDAIKMFEQVVPLRKAKLRPDHPDTLTSQENLALAYLSDGQLEKAIPNFEEVMNQRKRKIGAEDLETLAAMNLLGEALLESKRWPDAERVLKECLELRIKKTPRDWRRFNTMSQLGAAFAAQGRNADAEPLLTGGYEGMKARENDIPAHQKRYLASAAARIVPFFEAWEKPELAAKWRRELPPTGASDDRAPSASRLTPGGSTGRVAGP